MDPRARAVYRVDVRSFFDTDADGLGDINGVAAKIDYIKELGADTLMLSPVFSGEGFMIDPEIGTADVPERYVRQYRTFHDSGCNGKYSMVQA